MAEADDPTTRFTSRVDAYIAARPRYPREVIDHLRAAIGLDPSWRVVDVGSGTGISCELFLEHGNRVTAVEPNAAMRAAAEKSLRRYERFSSVAGAAEATTLPDASADLLVAAQAFHWFDPAAARAEALRILRAGGWALLMWNDRRLSGTPFLEAYEQLLIDFGTDYLKVRHNNVADEHFRAFFGPGVWKTATFPNCQRLDWDGLRARLLSSSYTPPAGEERHEPMLARLLEIFQRHRDSTGRVTIEYQTELFYAQPT